MPDDNDTRTENNKQFQKAVELIRMGKITLFNPATNETKKPTLFHLAAFYSGPLSQDSNLSFLRYSQ